MSRRLLLATSAFAALLGLVGTSCGSSQAPKPDPTVHDPASAIGDIAPVLSSDGLTVVIGAPQADPNTITAASPRKDVQRLQKLLVSKGFDAPTDGRYDTTTKNAVRDAQRQAALPVTGLADEQTVAWLNAQPSVSATTTAVTIAPIARTTVPHTVPAGCAVALVGDSLASGSPSTYEQALAAIGCSSVIDGLVSRSLTTGDLCASDRCGPQGISLLQQWSSQGKLGSVVVVALGTNDALGTQDWAKRWQDALDVIGSRKAVFVTTSAVGDHADAEAAYTKALRAWCPQHGCTVADWALDPAASNPASYAADGIHLTAAATSSRAALIARTVAAIA